MKLRSALLSTSLFIALGSASAPILAAEIYSDVPEDHWAQETLETLYQRYQIKLGYPDGSFQGQRTLTRYEMAALVLKLLQRENLASSDQQSLDALKQQFAKEIESLREEELEAIYDRLDLADQARMEGDEDLMQGLLTALPFDLSGSLAFRYQHLSDDNFATALSMTPQTRMTLSLDSREGKLPIAYGARLSVGNQRNPADPWWRLGDYFARVDFSLDRFFLSWQPTDFLDLTIGKFRNLYSHSELFMDADIQPEGAFQRLHFEKINSFWQSASVTLGETLLNTNALFSGQTFMLSALADSRFQLGDQWHLDLATAYHHYLNEGALAQANKIASDNSLSPRIVGNRNSNSPNAEFGVLNGFAALNWNPGIPVQLSGDYLYNLQASSKNQGFQAALRVGQNRQIGDWQLSYLFKYLEQDASIALFVEDQLGGTQIMAHEAQATVKVWDQTTLFGTYQWGQSLEPNEANAAARHTLRVGVHQAF